MPANTITTTKEISMPANARFRFSRWLDTFVEEKGLDTEHVFEVPGAGDDALWSMPHSIPLAVVIEAAKNATAREQEIIKDALVKLDYANADITRYFGHLAKAMVMARA